MLRMMSNMKRSLKRKLWLFSWWPRKIDSHCCWRYCWLYNLFWHSVTYGAFNIFYRDIVVMEMGSQLIMLLDFTNGLLRLVATSK